MKVPLLLAIAIVSAFTPLHAQEPAQLTAEELTKATTLLMETNTRLGDLPLKLELAPDKATGLKAGDAGALLIPDQRLKADKPDKADKKKNKGEAMPVGQLWTMKLAPKDKDTVLSNDKLRLVKVTTKDKELELAMFTLGIEKAGKKEFQLALYGKGSSPILRVPLTAEKSKGAAPVVMAARKTGEEAGVIELKLLGRYKAEIPVGKQAD